MLSDDTESAIPKLTDFGLSKILGPNQTSNQPFGTLGYQAPEVLCSLSYNFSCDIWSLGCLATAMLIGKLPFGNSKERHTFERTCCQELKFNSPIWKSTSNLAKDFISKTLEKDPSMRITL